MFRKKVSIVGGVLLIGICFGVWKYVQTIHTAPLPVRIMWLEWGLADMVQQMSADFTKETGIPVVIEQISSSRWQTIAYSEFATHHPRFDLVVGDSQWLGYAATNGYYINLTDFVTEHEIVGTYSESSTKDYGEYPADSGEYYAVPFSGNATGFAYRKDWFEDPIEQANFLARYGYELKSPRTTDELRDIAEFFYRPAEGKYGIVFPGSRTIYDSVSMSLGSFLFAFGGSWGDRANCVAEGYVNGQGAVDALEYLRGLYAFALPGTRTFGYPEAPKAFMEGHSAMLLTSASRFADVANPAKNPFASSTGYFPALFGPKSQYAQLFGQGISLVQGARNAEGAMKFLEWWIRKDTQEKFAARGGFTTHREVIHSAAFKDVAPYNDAYTKSIELVRDYWNTPSYDTLLLVSQKHIGTYMTGETELSAQETLNAIAREWGPVLENDCK